jgi:hypothetical protein
VKNNPLCWEATVTNSQRTVMKCTEGTDVIQKRGPSFILLLNMIVPYDKNPHNTGLFLLVYLMRAELS